MWVIGTRSYLPKTRYYFELEFEHVRFVACTRKLYGLFFLQKTRKNKRKLIMQYHKVFAPLNREKFFPLVFKVFLNLRRNANGENGSVNVTFSIK